LHITSSTNTHGQRFSLVWAFAISIACHVLLLWPAASAWREAVPSVPMVASLRPLAAPVATVQPAVAPTVPRQRVKPDLAAQAVFVAEPTEARDADTSNQTMSSATGSEPIVATPTSEPPPAAATGLPPSAGLDADGLRSFRVALAREVRRYKRYPVRADEARWEGTVVLHVSVPTSGAPAVQLAKSSGYSELDDAALEMLRRALPSTTIPASLRERAFSVELPVVFELP
jgi:periplasmic protein TonB